VYWRDVNPLVILEKYINVPGLTVLAAIPFLGIIGPIFFEGSVTKTIIYICS